MSSLLGDHHGSQHREENITSQALANPSSLWPVQSTAMENKNEKGIASKLVASQNFSRILIVMSILTVLPMANLASPFLATFRYQTPSQEEMKKILAFSDRGELLFDLVVTMREQIMPLDYVMIVPGYALCYMPNTKAKVDVGREFLEKNFKDNGASCKISIYKDWKDYLRALDKLSISKEQGSDRKIEKIKELFLSLSV